jgi:hypothetical protein
MSLAKFISDYCPLYPTLENSRQMTPLFYCTTPEEIDVLISCGANVDHVNYHRQTSVDLLLAQDDPDLSMIGCLMRHGAKIDCWNNKRMKQLRHDHLWDFVAEYCICELECRKSALVYLHCLKQSGIFPRDIRKMMVKFLLRTRRWYDWSPEFCRNIKRTCL